MIKNNVKRSSLDKFINTLFGNRVNSLSKNIFDSTDKYIPIATGDLRDSSYVKIKNGNAILGYGSDNDRTLNIYAVVQHEVVLNHLGNPPQSLIGAKKSGTGLKQGRGAIKLTDGALYGRAYREAIKSGKMKRYAAKYLLKGVREAIK